MDTLTHGLAGALLASALPLPHPTGPASPSNPQNSQPPSLRTRAVLLGFAAAVVPDLDVVPDPFSAEFYIRHHRGLTHSFLLAPFWAAPLALLFCLRRPHAPGPPLLDRLALRPLFLVATLGIAAGHILLDWVTSWGTMFFSPLSWNRYLLDWLFIVDFVLSGLLLSGLAAAGLATLATRLRRTTTLSPLPRTLATSFLLLSVGYIAYCGVQHHRALAIAQGLARPAATAAAPTVPSPSPPFLPRRPREPVAAVPQPLSPWRWLLLWNDHDSVRIAFLDLRKSTPSSIPSPRPEELEGLSFHDLVRRLPSLYRAPGDLDVHTFPCAPGPWARRALDESTVYAWFARFPVATESTAGPSAASGLAPDPSRVRVTIRDLRFSHIGRSLDPFTFVIDYDGGQKVAARFPSPRWRQSPPPRAGDPPTN